MLDSNELLQLTEAIQLGALQPEAIKAVQEIYDRLQVEINQRKPICVASGKCCRFESYGHRLYITTLELAKFTADAQAIEPVVLSKPLPVISGGCPLQQGKLCSVHAIRPFGCRIFFCDPTATDWQQQHYEQFHKEIKHLHQRFQIPYFYLEWRTALTAIKGISPLINI